MKKTVKASIAVGAGVILLLGGGGTLALWNSSADLSDNSIVSGKLKLTAPSAGAWYEASDWSTYKAAHYTGTAPTALDADYTVVPGDDLVFVVQGATLEEQGTNLHFTWSLTGLPTGTTDGFTVDTTDIDATASAADGTPDASPIKPTGVAAATGDYTGVAAGTLVYSGTATDVTLTFNAATEVTFLSSSADDGTNDQGKTLDLSDVALAANQVVAP